MDKRTFIESAISVPATLAVSTEIFSEVYHNVAQTSAEAFAYVGDVAQLGSATGDLVMTLYGSHDGETFFAQSAKTIAWNATSAVATAVGVAKFAPYFKVGIKSTATGGLEVGHGVKVSVILVEEDHEYKRAYNAINMTAATDYVPIMLSSGTFEKVNMFIYASTGTITDLDLNLETSMDGSVWYPLGVVKDTLLQAGLPYSASFEGYGFMKYVRVDPTALVGGTVKAALYGVGY